jgi:hypothetical protein
MQSFFAVELDQTCPNVTIRQRGRIQIVIGLRQCQRRGREAHKVIVSSLSPLPGVRARALARSISKAFLVSRRRGTNPIESYRKSNAKHG